MTLHLTEEQISNYRRLDADQLFAAENHLTACESCRNRLSELENRKDRSETFRSYFQPAESDHLLYEELKAYIDEELDETDREILESHLSICNQCKLDAADLREMSQELISIQGSGKPSFGKLMLFLWRSPEYSTAFKTVSLAAAAAFVALLTGLIFMGPRNNSEAKLNEAQQQNQELQEKVKELETKNKNLEQKIPETTGKPLLVSLLDGKSRIEMDQSGNLYGAGSYPDAYRKQIQEVLATGNLQNPAWLNDLGSNATIRGETNIETKQFATLSPVGIVVESDRPTFQWTAVKGAHHYQVRVFDNKFQFAAASTEVETLTWTPEKPLERGTFYSWKVDAFTENGIVTAPLLPAPEAKFKVLEEKTMRQLKQLRLQAPDSHLLKAIVYTDAGLVQEASKELEELRKANPDSLFVRKLSPK